MPAWSPEIEGLAPFDEDDEIRTDLPSELSAFIQRFEIKNQFTIEVKLWNNEAYSGRPKLVGRLEGMVPDYSAVVRMNGPGYYGFDTTWLPKGGKPRTEMLKVSLVGAQWTDMYKEALKEKKKQEIEDAKHEAEVERARNGGAPVVGSYKDPNASGREYMKSMLGDMKDLADTFGLGVGGAKAQPPGGEMGMLFLGMMNMMAKSSENQMNMMIAMMQNQNKGNDLKETFGLVREMVGMRDGLMPRDKSWIEEIVGAISENLGPIAGLFMRGNPSDDPLHQKVNEGLSETRERAQEDPAFLKGLVKHMDKKVGPKMTDKILKGFLNVTRPGAKASETPQEPQDDPGTSEGEA